MVVKWTELAEDKLKQIFDYYLDVAGYNVAQKIVAKIKNSSDLLEIMPVMAPIEKDLEKHKFVFRSLIVGKIFKIVYFIDDKAECVIIATIWDCRRDPEILQMDIS